MDPLKNARTQSALLGRPIPKFNAALFRKDAQPQNTTTATTAPTASTSTNTKQQSAAKISRSSTTNKRKREETKQQPPQPPALPEPPLSTPVPKSPEPIEDIPVNNVVYRPIRFFQHRNADVASVRAALRSGDVTDGAAFEDVEEKLEAIRKQKRLKIAIEAEEAATAANGMAATAGELINEYTADPLAFGGDKAYERMLRTIESNEQRYGPETSERQPKTASKSKTRKGGALFSSGANYVKLTMKKRVLGRTVLRRNRKKKSRRLPMAGIVTDDIDRSDAVDAETVDDLVVVNADSPLVKKKQSAPKRKATANESDASASDDSLDSNDSGSEETAEQLLIPELQELYERETAADSDPTTIGARVRRALSMRPELMRTILQNHFEYSDFRTGQAEVICRVLRGESTLVVLPTGAGKSLCFQYPALVYAATSGNASGSVALVVSPLVALMQDQLQRLPRCLRGALLRHGQSQADFTAVVSAIRSNQLHVLFVSPERLTSPLFLRTLRGTGLSFVCIDEAHCVSDWSHNFRPAYLSLATALRSLASTTGESSRLLPNASNQMPTILGLTGSCTVRTQRAVMRLLALPSEEPAASHAVVRMPAVTVNDQSDGSGASNTESSDDYQRFSVSVSLLEARASPQTRFAALVELLTSQPRFDPTVCRSLLIYTMRQRDADSLATNLALALAKHYASTGPTTSSKSQRSHWSSVVSYHAGLTQAERSRRQTFFIENKVRVMVATVAFGMGIDKADIDAVIHYSLPRSLEAYVQEIGRARRQRLRGSPAACHLFLTGAPAASKESNAADDDNAEDDVSQMRLMGSADTVDTDTIFTALRSLVFYPSNNQSPAAREYEVAIDEEIIELTYDIKREVFATILAYLESDDVSGGGSGYLRLIGTGQAYTGTVSFLRTAPAELALQSPVVAAILQQQSLSGSRLRTPGSHRQIGNSQYTIDLSKVALAMGGVSLAQVRDWLAELQRSGELHFDQQQQQQRYWRNNSSQSFANGHSPRGFVVRVLRVPPLEDQTDDSTEPTLWELADRLAGRLSRLEKLQLHKLETIHSLMSDFASPTPSGLTPLPSNQMHDFFTRINQYFNDPDIDTHLDADADAADTETSPLSGVQQAHISADIKVLLQQNRQLLTNHSEAHRRLRFCSCSRVVARILLGISSPAYNAREWASHRCWRSVRNSTAANGSNAPALFSTVRSLAQRVIDAVQSEHE